MDHFVKARHYLASSQPLHLLPRLHQQMPFRNLYSELLASAHPSIQAIVPRFAVDCEQVVVVVEASQDLAGFCLPEVDASWSHVKLSISNLICESGHAQPKTKGSHFRYS